jgi:hypothetical protein
MKRFLLLLITLLMSYNAYTLEMYTCSNEDTASSCSSCKKLDMNISFKVNIENQVVIKTIDNGYSKSVFGLEGCNVVDKKNWICKSTWTNGNLLQKNIMSEGVFLNVWYNFYGPATHFSCAK